MLKLAGALVVGLGLATAAVAPEAATASAPIKPNQHFIGLVNGKHAHAVIYVLCAGPATGQGHVISGQTVAVKHVQSGGGDTGAGASVIYARINPTTIVAMKRYQQPQPIPTSTQLPCQGTGTVTFSTCPLPQPCGSGAQPDNVPVEYLNPGAG